MNDTALGARLCASYCEVYVIRFTTLYLSQREPELKTYMPEIGY